MKGYITKQNAFYRFQQLVILVLHLILLRWMFYTLSETGGMTTTIVFVHFAGMSIYGGLLIRGCAAWAKHHHLKETQHAGS